MQLSAWPLPYVRVKCAKCDREGRMNTARLIERFGPTREMSVVREKLTADGCKRVDQKHPCLSILPDALLVQAITAATKGEVLQQKLIEEAANWNPKWLEETN